MHALINCSHITVNIPQAHPSSGECLSPLVGEGLSPPVGGEQNCQGIMQLFRTGDKTFVLLETPIWAGC